MFESRNGMKIVPNLPVDFTAVDGGREGCLPQKSLCSRANLTRGECGGSVPDVDRDGIRTTHAFPSFLTIVAHCNNSLTRGGCVTTGRLAVKRKARPGGILRSWSLPVMFLQSVWAVRNGWPAYQRP